jgi:hypothetical protein
MAVPATEVRPLVFSGTVSSGDLSVAIPAWVQGALGIDPTVEGAVVTATIRRLPDPEWYGFNLAVVPPGRVLIPPGAPDICAGDEIDITFDELFPPEFFSKKPETGGELLLQLGRMPGGGSWRKDGSERLDEYLIADIRGD